MFRVVGFRRYPSLCVCQPGAPCIQASSHHTHYLSPTCLRIDPPSCPLLWTTGGGACPRGRFGPAPCGQAEAGGEARRAGQRVEHLCLRSHFGIVFSFCVFSFLFILLIFFPQQQYKVANKKNPTSTSKTQDQIVGTTLGGLFSSSLIFHKSCTNLFTTARQTTSEMINFGKETPFFVIFFKASQSCHGFQCNVFLSSSFGCSCIFPRHCAVRAFRSPFSDHRYPFCNPHRTLFG